VSLSEKVRSLVFESTIRCYANQRASAHGSIFCIYKIF